MPRFCFPTELIEGGFCFCIFKLKFNVIYVFCLLIRSIHTLADNFVFKLRKNKMIDNINVYNIPHEHFALYLTD